MHIANINTTKIKKCHSFIFSPFNQKYMPRYSKLNYGDKKSRARKEPDCCHPWARPEDLLVP